jgi:hypothetical protein
MTTSFILKDMMFGWVGCFMYTMHIEFIHVSRHKQRFQPKLATHIAHLLQSTATRKDLHVVSPRCYIRATAASDAGTCGDCTCDMGDAVVHAGVLPGEYVGEMHM